MVVSSCIRRINTSVDSIMRDGYGGGDMASASKVVKLVEEQIPTIVSYEVESEKFTIGEEAKKSGLKGITNAYNFKTYIGKSDTEYKEQRYWIAPTGVSDRNTKLLSAEEVAKIYIKEILGSLDISDNVVIGIPGIQDSRWVEKYKSNMRQIFASIGASPPEFYYEPFAIYNAYREASYCAGELASKEDVLIMDIGGSTINSCIIRTNGDGSLYRSGAYSVPLGVNAEFYGGSELDKCLLEDLIEKLRRSGIEWKEDPIRRALSGKNPVLFFVEKAKISMCDKLKNSNINEQYNHIKEQIRFKNGWLHSDKELIVELDGDDIKHAISKMWETKWMAVISDTIRKANKRISEGRIGDKDKVNITRTIFAGGSSDLPFLKQLFNKGFRTFVGSQEILHTKKPGTTVATGLACECKYQTSRSPNLFTARIAPCLLDELYFGVSINRRDTPVPVLTKSANGDIPGKIISAPFAINGYKTEATIDLPFQLEGKFVYSFSNKPFVDATDGKLNISNDTARLPFDGKSATRAKLIAEFREDGVVRCTLQVKQAHARSTGSEYEIAFPEFDYPNLSIRNGETFYGFDFGNSNSYIVKLHTSTDTPISASVYPSYTISQKVKKKLFILGQTITGIAASREELFDFAEQIKPDHIYHSNRIEGILWSKGETERIVSGTGLASGSGAEVSNLSKAYTWAVENHNTLFDSPERFLREVNGMLLHGLSPDAGVYRSVPVRITGAQFIPPPPAALSSLMGELAKEIKSLNPSRSPLEMAVSIHTKFVTIHPFADGNGRTARLLLNCILLNFSWPPMVVSSHDRGRYISSLASSSGGDLSSALSFFLDAYDNNVECYLDFKSKEAQEAKESSPLMGEEYAELLPVATVHKTEELIPVSRLRLLFDSFSHLCRYCASKFQIHFPEVSVDIVSFESPSDDFLTGNLNEYERTKKWFSKISFSIGQRYEEFIFYYCHCAPIMIDEKPLSGICLQLSRLTDGDHVDLSIEPISLRDISTSDTKLIAFPLAVEVSEQMITDLFNEIRNSYLE